MGRFDDGREHTKPHKQPSLAADAVVFDADGRFFLAFDHYQTVADAFSLPKTAGL
jgi:hypothetical protein